VGIFLGILPNKGALSLEKLVSETFLAVLQIYWNMYPKSWRECVLVLGVCKGVNARNALAILCNANVLCV
jgi:hypothetical protein